MPLPAHLVAMFPPAARKQARAYVSGGDVAIRIMTADQVQAAVRGNMGSYLVEVNLASLDAPRMRCSCPDWDRWGPCKHLWATLIEADRAGLPVLQPDAPPDAVADDEPPPDWEGRLDSLVQAYRVRPAEPVVRSSSEVLYVVDRTRSRRAHALALTVFVRRRLRSGKWGILRSFAVASRDDPPVLQPNDRSALGALRGAAEWARDEDASDAFLLEPDQNAVFLPLLAATGRLLLGEPTADEEIQPLRWDAAHPWQLEATMVRDEDAARVRLCAEIVRGDDRRRPEDLDLCLATGLVIDDGVAAPLAVGSAGPWLRSFLDEGPIASSPEEATSFVERVLALPGAPRLRDAPVELVVGAVPRPHLEAQAAVESGPGWLDCRIFVDYGSDRVRVGDAVSAVLDADGVRRVVRDRDVEVEVVADVLRHPEALPPQGPDSDVSLPAGTLVTLLPALLEAGWTVEAVGKRYRASGKFKASVSSGIDWFGVTGGIDFGDGEVAAMPELLRAIRSGSRTVRLGDGSLGLLPEEVLRSWGLLSAIGRVEDEGLRFAKHQGWVIDALLAGKRGVDLDAEFEAYRERLRGFDGIGSRTEPSTFHGELRGYQREGLAWLDFLREFGCGGCLADDMGLGKTVQVLAMLEERRTDGSARGPALVVAPRSVVFNWVDEAARFTPELRVLDYTGPGRRRFASRMGRYDLIVTTYGVLRRDIEMLVDVGLDYAILDESQAVKNHATQASKAARALNARHRLALSGTPLENHLSELWSLFEFLNPGMLGRSTAFRRLTQKGGEGADREGRALLARALRPFLLRRTKEQVAQDLPEKTEQTLHCEMPTRQRRLYRELAQHYRESLLSKGAAAALAGSRMHVLEALLRLRQAACHPGLLDVSRQAEESAKLDALLPLLEEVIEEGHKALVFSQFTSMLAIVRDRLERAGIVHEYLDGQTRDRKERVDRFQADDACPVFLISLKAGGLGLNLTAADYVFILDPWWNPAVEAQAIDRTYRIGQTRHVMAYRLVCKDSVEEKILKLQERKRDLADAILSSDNAVLSDLRPEDLELLLS